jgi:hypothetical protein
MAVVREPVLRVAVRRRLMPRGITSGWPTTRELGQTSFQMRAEAGYDLVRYMLEALRVEIRDEGSGAS